MSGSEGVWWSGVTVLHENGGVVGELTLSRESSLSLSTMRGVFLARRLGFPFYSVSTARRKKGEADNAVMITPVCLQSQSMASTVKVRHCSSV